MSIASEISRLQGDSTAIANAITAKGVTVPSGSGFDDYATLIGNIQTGGGGANLTSLSVTPSTSAQQITPTSPVDGYNEVNVSAVTSSIDANIAAGNIKKDVSILGVTGTYEGGGGTDFDAWLKDGDTHLWINIVNDYQKEQHLRLRINGTIDWGDGSAKDTSAGTGYATFTHTYSDKGKYRIDLHPNSGTFYLGNSSLSYTIMGARSNSTFYRLAALYQAEIGSSVITTISDYALSYCGGLRKVYIPKNIVSAGDYVFAGDYALTKVEFEDASKLTTAGGVQFFSLCQGLQDIGGFSPTWGNTLNQVARNCYCLTEFTISSNVTNISASTFTNTYALRHLWVYPANPPTVANANAFTGINSGCVIHVPNGKLNTYKTASIWSTYASQMVEMPATT